VALVWVGEVEAAHPASTAATIPPTTMRPTLDITAVLPRHDRPHYSLHAPAPRQVAEIAEKLRIRRPTAPRDGPTTALERRGPQV
jgi:hypothetical protein